MEYIEQNEEVQKYMPEPVELEKYPRQWKINIIYTLVGEEFKKWVKTKVEEYHQKIKDQQNNEFEMDKEIYDLLKASK